MNLFPKDEKFSKINFDLAPTVAGCDFTANFKCRSFADYLNLPLLEVPLELNRL